MNDITKIHTERAPAAIGPYSQAMAVSGFVFTSGQIPMDANGQLVGETIQAQAKQSLENVQAVLEAAGTDCAHVVKTTCFLQDMADFATFNEIYTQYFPACPARSCVAVKTLPKSVLCEVEAIAVK